MSYPRQVHCLVIEDDPSVKQLYQEVFTTLAKEDPTILLPRYAFSQHEADAALDEPCVYHLVLLDLRLPERPNVPPEDGVAIGLQILERCRNRDAYPIPALLVVTAYADKTSQTQLRDTLRESFSYGELIIKGSNPIGEIRRAILRSRMYGDMGMHIHDSLSQRFPTLSPREDDLLRRAALENDVVGLDLRWWSAEYSKPTGQHAAFRGWTKVLMGHFLLGGGQGRSRPIFCKLMPARELDVVSRDAQLLEQKLPHIKVKGWGRGGDRSLLITEKAGETKNPPIPLDEYLSRPSSSVRDSIRAIAGDVISQTEMLGDSRADVVPIQTLLWPGHDEARISRNRERHRPQPALALESLRRNALDVLRTLRKQTASFRTEFRECTHGDLNVTNVAVDEGLDVRGYIFDASNIHKGLAMQDLATLEVTALLHLGPNTEESVVSVCGAALYGSDFIPSASDAGIGSDRVTNTLHLVHAIRNYANGDDTRRASYALCVFDAALIQVGGLTWPSGNKVTSFLDAVLLADLAAGWLSRVSPGFSVPA